MRIKKAPPRHWKIGAAIALALGLALTVGVVAHVGAGALEKAARAVGWGGFALYALVSALIFLPLGLAWKAAAPAVPARMFLAFVWGRIMREAASDILPLAQVTGLFVGVRAVGRRGIPEASVVGSLIIDLTTEMAAQVLYTLFGVSMLVATLAHVTDARDLLAAALLALLLGIGVLAVFVLLQGRGVDLMGRLGERWIEGTRARADAIRAELAGTYANRGALLSSFLLHILSWLASGATSWLALSMMGAHAALWRVLTLESLMAAVRAVAFISPGALGVQEGAYVLAAPLLGIAPSPALLLSLLKRAKDVAIGVPALLIWQAGESRALISSS
jgi:putative membrane protein